MPFQEGQIANPRGRPGYEFEKSQLEKMGALIEKYLQVAERILTDTEKPSDAKKIQLLSADMRKILDKLHASRSDFTSKGERLPPQIMFVQSELMNKYDIPPSPIPNSE